MRSVSLILFGAVNAFRFAEDGAKKNRPVTKVVNLLKDMSKQLETEAEQDEEIYEKMKCWCKENDGAKSKAIKEAEVKILNLQGSIEKGVAKSAQLSQEIENHDKERKDQIQSLKEAQALREKEAAEFNEKNKEVVQAISALKSAITVLNKHQKNSSGKTNKGALTQTKVVMDNLFQRYGDSILAGVTQHDRKQVTAFLQAPVNDYQSQSGQIFGILQNMLDTFIADNKDALDEEQAKAKAFAELKAEKEKAIALLQKQIDEKTNIQAATDAQVGQDKQEINDTRNNLGEDEKFLAMLKEKCAQTDDEWTARTKERSLEQAAVAKAIQFLNSDEAHDLFSGTFNKGAFVQTSKVQESRRMRASSILKKFPKLAMLATKVRLDAFTKVHEAIDKMLKDLKEQKDAEIAQNDACVARFQENAMETQKTTQQKEEFEAQKEALEQKIENTKKKIEELNQAIADDKAAIKKAGEDRAAENAEFQVTVQEQRASIELLGKAMSVLKGFYEKNKALMQTEAGEPAGPPPPAGFKKYEQNAAGSGVIGMITEIINDSKALEAEALRDEKEAQTGYEKLVQDTNASIKANEKAVMNNTDALATAKIDHVETSQALKDANLQLTALGETNKALHTECDFLQKNFDIRQEAFDQEMDALKQAKAILSGSDFKA